MPSLLPSEVVGAIDRIFSWATTLAGADRQIVEFRQSTELAAAATMLDEIPRELLLATAPDPPADSIGFVAATAAVKDILEYWRSGHPDAQRLYLQGTPGISEHLNPVGVIRAFLAKCPDEVIPPATTELPFLTKSDPELRDNLRLDLAHAERALTNGEWKASTVLSGSVIEALLFWALDQPKYQTLALNANAAPKDSGVVLPLNKWTLSSYIAVAVQIGLLSTADTITEAKLSQNYRNLIHQGRATRLGQRCDKGTAQVAAAGASHVASELVTRFP
jgi:hypothetical protein